LALKDHCFSDHVTKIQHGAAANLVDFGLHRPFFPEMGESGRWRE